MNHEAIFVIDDDREFRDVVCWALECEGFIVSSFDGPAKALDVLRTECKIPGLIIVDFHMPEMLGTEFIIEKNKIQNKYIQSCPSILLTASSEDIDPADRENLFIEILPKPIGMETLIALVKKKLIGATELYTIPLEKRILYLDKYIHEINSIKQSKETNDLKKKAILNYLHKAKGSAKTFGFGPLGEQAAYLGKKIGGENFKLSSADIDGVLGEILENLKICKAECR